MWPILNLLLRPTMHGWFEYFRIYLNIQTNEPTPRIVSTIGWLDTLIEATHHLVSGDEGSLPLGRSLRGQDPLPPARLRLQLAALEGHRDDPDDGRRG